MYLHNETIVAFVSLPCVTHTQEHKDSDLSSQSGNHRTELNVNVKDKKLRKNQNETKQLFALDTINKFA